MALGFKCSVLIGAGILHPPLTGSYTVDEFMLGVYSTSELHL